MDGVFLMAFSFVLPFELVEARLFDEVERGCAVLGRLGAPVVNDVVAGGRPQDLRAGDRDAFCMCEV